MAFTTTFVTDLEHDNSREWWLAKVRDAWRALTPLNDWLSRVL